MRKLVLFLFLFIAFSLVIPATVKAQCSICTRTAQQLGEKPAKGLNAGIIYLAFTPIVILSVVGYKWYRRNS